MKNLVPLSALAALLLPLSASAAPSLKSSHGDWKVYTNGSGNARICYALAEAENKSPSNVDHGKVVFMVSNWKSGAAKEQPSLLTGYSLKTTRAPKASVDTTTVTMYGADNEAFVQSAADERKLVAKMRAGAMMSVSAVSTRGTQTRYQFSLKGVTAALTAARTACR